MGTHVMVCANCSGAVHFPPGQSFTTCAYCGFQLQLDGTSPAAPEAAPPSGPQLATSIGIRASPTMTFPLLTAGTALPAQHHETLSTQRDNQESITIDLVHGAHDLVKVTFPIHARSPRGTVFVQMLIKIDASGTGTLFVTERGTTNTLRRDDLRIQVQR